MTATPLPAAETERIAALLAEVMPHVAVTPPPLPPEAMTQSVRAYRAAVAPPKSEPSAPPARPEYTSVGQLPVRDLLGQANWRNESPDALRDEPPPAVHVTRDVGPLPAPFGVLTVTEVFALVNWRNRPDEVQSPPLIKPPPPTGVEFTVAAMLPTFGWE
jgi:hypothetical protein